MVFSKAQVFSFFRVAVVCTYVVTIVCCKDDEDLIGRKPVSYIHDSSLAGLNNNSLLLNVNASATHNMTINTWSFCYSIKEMEASKDITIGVWRPSGNHSYSLVSGSHAVLPQSDSYLEFEFICRRIFVDQFEVEMGDVIGVVMCLPAMFSVVGIDRGGELCWTPSFDSESVNESDFSCFEGHGLYIEGSFSEESSETTISSSTTTTMTVGSTIDTPETQNTQPTWTLYLVGVLSLLVISSFFTICVLSITLHRKNRKVKMSTTSREVSLELGLEHEAGPVTRYQPVVSRPESTSESNSPPSVFANSEREHPPGNRQKSQTFSFPPPESRAPLPPVYSETSRLFIQGKSSSSNDISRSYAKELTQLKLPQSLSSATLMCTSLPSLLYEETVYEDPDNSTPTPYMDFVPSNPKSPSLREVEAASTLPPAESESTDTTAQFVPDYPGNVSPILSIATDNGEGKVDRELGLVSSLEPSYGNINIKTKLSRLQSDPLSNGSTSSPEYAEPISIGKRPRFYSSHGAKVPNTKVKVGSFKKPIPLPKQNFGSMKSLDQLESSLEKIVEVEETETVVAAVENSSNHSEHKEPEMYLEPAQLKKGSPEL